MAIEKLSVAELGAVTFRVDAVPVAQPRARATAINGKARMYEAKAGHAIHAFKASVRLAWSQTGSDYFDGPLAVSMVFVMPRPKRLKTGGRVAFDRKPDFDNLGKSTADSLNELAWHDDSQICDARVQKWYAASDESPHVVISIREFKEQP